MRTTLLVLLIALGPVAAAVPVAPPPLASPPVAPPMIDDEATPPLPKDGAVDGEWTYKRDPGQPGGGYWYRYRYVLRSVSAGAVLQNCKT